MTDMTPGSPEWLAVITASKVPAILGVSPWDSPRSMWLKMHGDLPQEPGNDATRRGHYLEAGVLAWWQDQHPDFTSGGQQPHFEMGDWAAATPDMYGLLPDDTSVLVEAKTAAYDDDWGDPGTDAIPTYYYAQVLWQMHVSGVHRCYVPVLTSRLRFAEYVVDYDPDQAAVLERLMREFYDSLSADTPPPLDDTVATFDAMRKVHPDIDRGDSVEVPAELAHNLVNGQHAYKAAETSLRLSKTLALAAMGRAQYLTHDGVKIARRQSDGPDRTKFVVVGKPSDLTDQQGDAA